jgi:hypothetical protein
MHILIVLGVGGLVAIAADVGLRCMSRESAASEARRQPGNVRRADRPDVVLGRRGRDAFIVTGQQPMATDSHDAPPFVIVRLATRRRRSPRIVAPRRPPNRAARRDM